MPSSNRTAAPTGLVFPTLADLHANRGLRRRPDGSYWEDSFDYGVWWRDREGRVYRLTWIGAVGRDENSADPGELYVVRLGGPTVSPLGETGIVVSVGDALGAAELLCVIPPVDGDRPDENVEAILTGWAEVCGLPGSLDWIRDRVYEALRAKWATPAAIVRRD